MNLSRLVSILLLGLFLTACDEDFQLTEPFKSIPVVYGFLDRTDTAQYIRVEKAFVNEDIAASTIAQNPDSLYFANPEVKIINLTQSAEYTLTKVDGNLEGFVRNSGPFATSPNILYKIKTNAMQWNGGDSMQIKVSTGELADPVTARIASVSDMKFTFPDDNTKQLKFFSVNNYDLQWKHRSNARLFKLKALVYVEEVNIQSGTSEIKIIELPITDNLPGREGNGDIFTSIKFFSSSLYNFLHDKLTPETGVERYLLKLDFHLVGGGPEIKDYFEILNANTGITASQEIPRYTNLSHGFGIFSSTHSIVRTVTPQSPTLDSLQAHPLTRDLNFK
ncbi:MAG: DUF4249 family protein [Saprospiraceae bacterium]|nr:DUF4249 family protein [Saprospiraceae bacterium]